MARKKGGSAHAAKQKTRRRDPKKILKALGPGLITGASDDDPSGIATYSQTGAQFGYAQLWVSLFTTPFMIAIQEMCGRIGIVTGKGLAGVLRTHYSHTVLNVVVGLLLIANIINIGADLGAMAEAAQLLTGWAFGPWIIVITLTIIGLEVFIPYKKYKRFLKFLTLSLFAYIAAAFMTEQPWVEILKSTVIPHVAWSEGYMINIIALLGTTLSPYLFFWEANGEVEEEIEHHRIKDLGKGRPRFSFGDIKHMRLDNMVGMIFSNVVMFFICTTAASTLFANGITDISTAAQAAAALEPFAGKYTSLIFGLGIIGTGLLAVPVLAGSASYAVAETMQWSAGLSKKINKAYGFYGVMTVATLVGLSVNFVNIPPFKMLYYTAIINGVIAPPLMIMIMLIANNKKIMGNNTNGPIRNLLGWSATLMMSAATIGLFIVLL